MIDFRILGQIALTGVDVGAAQQALRQPKRLALLAYLACEPRVHARDALMGLFWGDSTQARAQGSLRKALHFLRDQLGGEAILSHGHHGVELNRDFIRCDAALFFDALRPMDLERALAHYRGDLLPGLFVTEAPEFEGWLQRKRLRLRLDAHGAAAQLAAGASERGETDRALFWARQASAIRPEDEQVLRLTLTLLDRLGRRGEALEVGKRFTVWMGKELGAEPSPETVELLNAIRSRKGLSAGVQPGSPAPEARESGDALFREIVETAAEFIYRADTDGRFTYVSPSCTHLLGYTASDLLGKLQTDLVRPDRREEVFRAHLEQLRQRKPITYQEIPALHADGRTVWLAQSVRLLEREGEVAGVQAVARDITTRKRMEGTQRRLECRDPLTRLYDERGFREVANDRIRLARRSGSGLALVVTDLAGGAPSGGPAPSDRAIAAIAALLKQSVRASDILARPGPTSFVILALCDSAGTAQVCLERIRERVAARKATPDAADLSLSLHAIFSPSAVEWSAARLLATARSPEVLDRDVEAPVQVIMDAPRRDARIA